MEKTENFNNFSKISNQNQWFLILNKLFFNSINIHLHIYREEIEIENVSKYEKMKKIFKFHVYYVYDRFECKKQVRIIQK